MGPGVRIPPLPPISEELRKLYFETERMVHQFHEAEWIATKRALKAERQVKELEKKMNEKSMKASVTSPWLDLLPFVLVCVAGTIIIAVAVGGIGKSKSTSASSNSTPASGESVEVDTVKILDVSHRAWAEITEKRPPSIELVKEVEAARKVCHNTVPEYAHSACANLDDVAVRYQAYYVYYTGKSNE